MRHHVADLEIGRTRHDRDAASAEINPPHFQGVAARMCCELDDAANRHTAPVAAHLVHVLDLEAGQGQPIAQLGQRHVDLDKLAQPAQRHLHLNCSRKRRSLA